MAARRASLPCACAQRPTRHYRTQLLCVDHYPHMKPNGQDTRAAYAANMATLRKWVAQRTSGTVQQFVPPALIAPGRRFVCTCCS